MFNQIDIVVMSQDSTLAYINFSMNKKSKEVRFLTYLTPIRNADEGGWLYHSKGHLQKASLQITG